MSLYEGAVKKPIMTSLCFLAVAIFGLFSLSKLPVDLYPDIDTNTIMVMTSYQGASASDIENNVTRPLENTLNSVSNLKHITSKSSENISVITLEFEYGYDIDVLTNDVRDKLDMVSSELPDEVNTPIIFKFSTDMIPILLLSVQAEESQPALYKILDDNVVNPLARVPGVGTVSIAGAPKREVNIYCDPNKLEAYDLTIETISSIVGCLFLNKVDTLKSTIMKKKEEQLQISLDRVKLQKHVYELCRVQKLTINEVRKKTGLGMGTIYRYLHTFEEENPKLVEQMKKQGPNIIPEDYKKLQEEVLRLKCELKRERLRADFYEEMVAFGKEVYGIDLKKAGTK